MENYILNGTNLQSGKLLYKLYDSVHVFRFSSRLIVDLFRPSPFEILLIESPFAIPHSMISLSIVLR